MRPSRLFGALAVLLPVLLLAGSVIYWAFGLTFGLISGLVLLMAPLYPLLFQAGVTATVVSLCLWREAFRTAIVLGLGCVILPQAALVAWYGRELWRCQHAADPSACFDYLNGSPILPALVGLALLVAAVEATGVVVVAGGAWKVTRSLPEAVR